MTADKTFKEIVLYVFFGGLTTIVSIGVYYLFAVRWDLNELVANVISWIAAVAFAYVSNRRWVFRSQVAGMKAICSEAGGFFGGRLLTLLLEESFILVFITILGFNSMLVKLVAQIFVMIGNYLISKLVVFRKHPRSSKGAR